MELLPQSLHLGGGDQTQVAALQGAFRKLRQESQGLYPAPEPLPDGLRQSLAGHGGTPIEDDPPDAAVRLEIQESLDHRQDGQRRALRRDHQNSGSLRRPGGLPAAGKGAVQTGPIVVAHDPFDDGHVPVPAVSRQQIPQGVLPEEEQIQIAALRPDDPAVEHGVDIVRAAFEGPHPQTPVHQSLKDRAGNGGLPAPAADAGQQDTRRSLFHEIAPCSFFRSLLYRSVKVLST